MQVVATKFERPEQAGTRWSLQAMAAGRFVIEIDRARRVIADGTLREAVESETGALR